MASYLNTLDVKVLRVFLLLCKILTIRKEGKDYESN